MPQAGNFACESCGKEYRWKPELAGKRVKCKCGGVMTVPAAAPEDEQDIYGMSDPEPEPTQRPTTVAPKRAAAAAAPAVDEGNEYRCPYCQQSIEPGSAVCPMCGTNLRTGKKPAAAAAMASVPRRTTAAPAARKAPAVQSGGNGKLIGAIVAGVIVIGAAIYGIKFFNSSSSGGKAAMAKLLPQDQKVEEQIKEEYGTEARKWLENDIHQVMGLSKKQALYKIDEAYQMGAKRVMAFGAGVSTTLAIELPDDAAKRKAILDWANKWNSEIGYKPDKEEGQKWVVLAMHV